MSNQNQLKIEGKKALLQTWEQIPMGKFKGQEEYILDLRRRIKRLEAR